MEGGFAFLSQRRFASKSQRIALSMAGASASYLNSISFRFWQLASFSILLLPLLQRNDHPKCKHNLEKVEISAFKSSSARRACRIVPFMQLSFSEPARAKEWILFRFLLDHEQKYMYFLREIALIWGLHLQSCSLERRISSTPPPYEVMRANEVKLRLIQLISCARHL